MIQIHVVNVGDTLWKISRLYGASIFSIAEANLVTNPDRLVLGQALVIPTARGNHIVRPGDNLWSIAQLYGISSNVIANDNRIINPALLYPGQILYIRRSVIDVNGYLAKTYIEGQKVVNDLGDYLSSLSISSYHIQQHGSLIPMQIINNQDIVTMNDA